MLGFRFSIAPHLLGSAGFQASREKLVPIWPTRFRQDALAAGGGDDRVGLCDGPGTHIAGQPNQRGRMVYRSIIGLRGLSWYYTAW